MVDEKNMPRTYEVWMQFSNCADADKHPMWKDRERITIAAESMMKELRDYHCDMLLDNESGYVKMKLTKRIFDGHGNFDEPYVA